VSVGSWLQIRVVLLSGRGTVLDLPPGRVMVVSSGHTLGRLANAIDLAFGRWDLAHLHAFRLTDGRTYLPEGDDVMDDVLDSTRTRISSLRLEAGDAFEYVFDLGDDWTHSCTVEEIGIDPRAAWGGAPPGPVPVWGWGTIPDQYGRIGPDE
jgi:hypothetical protein